jgi:membrane fusion protein (multidrug efflux system)
MRYRRLNLRTLTPLLVLLLLSATGCKKGGDAAAGKTGKTGEPAPPPTMALGPEDTAVVTPGPVESGPALTGTLTAQRQAAIRAQIAGSVLTVTAEPGQAVTRGETLARLDSSALTDAYNSARSAATSAKSALAVAEREAARQETLVKAGAVAQRNVETAQQSVVAARATLAQAQAQIASAEKQLANTTVTAPFSGVVSERPVSAGDVVQPGTSLYTVVDPSSLQLEAAIPAEQLAALKVGSPVGFTITGYGDRTFKGSITRINPSADPTTRQVRVYAEIPNPGGLVAGLYAEGRVESESRHGLTLPIAAIDRRMAKPAVLVVRDGKVARVDVQLGLADEKAQRVEVLQGVAAGDVVLLGAAQEIAPGTPVTLAPSVQQAAERLAQKL